MKSNTIILIIAILYLGIFFAHALFLNKTVYGDGVYYYAWLQNAVVDHTADASAPGNKYSIGPAMLWSPAFLLVHNVLRKSGFELPYQLVVGGMSVLYAIVGLVLLSRFLPASVIAAIAGATNLLFYGSVDTVNSHALSFFAATVFLSLLFSKQKNWFAIGVSLGLIALIRPQDLIYSILLFSVFKKSHLTGDALQGEILRNLRKFTFGFFTVFFLQLYAWYITTGKFVSPYLTGNEGFDFLHPHILGVLFSPQNGLFLWTPIVFLGCLGLWKKYKIFLVIIVIQVYLVSSWSTWNQGASYSGRMFVSVLPLVAFGLASVFNNFRNIKLHGLPLYLAFIFPLTFINISLIIFFLWSLS